MFGSEKPHRVGRFGFFVNGKTGLVVPPSVRRLAGIKNGDRVEFRVSGGVINIVPRLPPAADECTTAQKRIIDRDLAKGLADIKRDVPADYVEGSGRGAIRVRPPLTGGAPRI